MVMHRELLPLKAEDVVACARSWLGTPYHHQACRKHVGCDCLGLVRGMWVELYGAETERAPAYTRDWAEASRTETMLEAAGRHFQEVDIRSMQAGDLVVFRLRENFVAKHAAVLSSDTTMIHAVERTCLSEVALSGWWRRRIAGAFRFPGVEI